MLVSRQATTTPGRSVPFAPISANGAHSHAQPHAARIPPIESCVVAGRGSSAPMSIECSGAMDGATTWLDWPTMGRWSATVPRAPPGDPASTRSWCCVGYYANFVEIRFRSPKKLARRRK
jgi:hypothetical protein